jgi:hypothetical protein
MFKLALGSLAAAFAMFITGFLYFAGPMAMLGYGTASEAQNAAVQTALAANLPATGTYMIPDPSTQAGTILYGKGPVATVHYNSQGFSLESMDGIVWGFGLYLVVAILIAAALSQLGNRVTDFRSRATIVVCFSLATSVMLTLGDPIWLHQDWTYAIFGFIGNALMLIIAGLVIARWFLPKAAEAAPLPVEQPQESASV